MNNQRQALKIHITGVVQGVGFRPFVYGLATRHELLGWVCNTSAGVDIEVEGEAQALQRFVDALTDEAPPLAHIDQVTVNEIPDHHLDGYTQFSIRHSQAQPGAFQPISPDICTCEDCRRELLDPQDRRYRYPFINCTNCGPRFTIIQDIPYDRPKTTMAPFEMCPDCQAEYDDPLNRRFHAQPNACPVCGPQVTLWVQDPEPRPISHRDEALQATRARLAQGQIIAVKGLGGFHLACDATNAQAVARLRARKGRIDKPFALMAFDLETVEACCHVNQEERELLTRRERPIVLLQERAGSAVSSEVAPGIDELGVMLPYTPLHDLLLAPGPHHVPLLVMTSGNYSEEPIATGNDEALQRLGGLADAFLMHDRAIHARCDDSVTRVFQGAEIPLRRSRGYAPYPVHLPFETRPILAVGAELKNTFCLTRARYAFLSQHIGDMENYETLRSFEDMVEQLSRTFRVEPEIIAYDMHPGYLSTQYALRMAQRWQEDDAPSASPAPQLIAVQHHHAHVAGCMAENGLDGSQPVIGVTFDGTGYGPDGAIWGGEFLIADYARFHRVAHLAYVPLPGGDTAIRKPYRTALAHLWAAGVPWDESMATVRAALPTERHILARQVESGLNAVPTSSMGRLFDAVSAIADVRQVVSYEAQAAIELQMLIDDRESGTYPWDIKRKQVIDTEIEFEIEIDAAPLIRAIAADVRAGAPAGVIAARFHNSVADMVRQVCRILRDETGLNAVALSGGVWQNMALLQRTVDRLDIDGFEVYVHRLVPPNDGGLSLGQAAVANAQASMTNRECRKRLNLCV